jgi:hypothetical protein
MPPGFYNPYDQQVYDAGFKYIPQSRYLLNPFQIPTDDSTTTPPNTGGITTLPTGGGGGGSTYTGTTGGLTSDFFNTTSDRQGRLTELNYPYRDGNVFFPGQRGDEIIMERLAPYGAPKDFYKNSIEGVPQTIKGAPGIVDIQPASFGRKIQETLYSTPFFNKPQTADQIIADGYTGKPGGGILGMMAGMVDKYGDLPRGDQAFIARNMGYTGPTVFGENTGRQDPFGLNVRSGFGNYAEAVGKQVDKLSAALGVGGAIGSKKDFQGAVFDPTTNSFKAADGSTLSDEDLAELNRRTKMVRAKYKFYTDQTKQRDADRKAAEEAARAAAAAQGRADLLASKKLTAEQRAQEERNISRVERAYREDTGGQGGSYSTGESGVQSDGSYNDPFDPGGGEKDGGFIDGTNRRTYYMDGGLADMLEIYD